MDAQAHPFCPSLPVLPSFAAGGGGAGAGAGGTDGDDAVIIASPREDVSVVVGPIFESEARTAVGNVFRGVCPWFTSSSPITTRLDLALGDESRQADLFAYCDGDTFEACSEATEAGIYVVWPEGGNSISESALPAAAIPSITRFSPADTSRRGPHKYFVGEAYSGTDPQRRREKVWQLETEVEFLMRRFAERSGLNIVDATSIIGAAAIIFPATKRSPRRQQVPDMLQLVRNNAGLHLQRLSRAGRLLLVLLSLDQAPQTAAQRDTTSLLREVRNEQRQVRDAQRQVRNEQRQVRDELAKIFERLPPIPEGAAGPVE